MILTELQIRRLRCLAEVRLVLDPGLNLILGANGAGKTSIIEAVHLLGYGRSFRGRPSEGLLQTGAANLEVYAEWLDGQNQSHRAGLRHAGQSWEARLDGSGVQYLAELCAQFAVVTFEPGTHELIAGGAEHRRRYLDWGLFHVEQDFLGCWRRYARALKQRNALLKSGPSPASLAPWERELGESGEALTRLRQGYLQQLEPFLMSEAESFIPELGEPLLEYRPGWKRAELSLPDSLLLNRERDLAVGHTTLGPHRADWRIGFSRVPGGEALSRGQEKLTALVCILGQARHLAALRGHWPIVCLDDLASELDAAHQDRVLGAVVGSGAQVLLTGTQWPSKYSEAQGRGLAVFHVERGVVRRE
ncbi:MAG: DNA replication/repair protein RecF [Arenimonas sp.]